MNASYVEIEKAAQRLAQGQLVVFPTETVYGLGGDAENPAAVRRIYEVKGRPASHPVIVHITPDADLTYWAIDIPRQAQRLITAFWPGPLTLILKRRPDIDAAVSGGQRSIGLRCPSHPIAQQLLRAFVALKPHGQGGIAAPSANRFGYVSPTRAEHIRTEFAAEVAAGMPVLQGGAATVGIESTIIDLSRIQEGIGPVLLRPGHIRCEEIAAILGIKPHPPDAAAPRAPGRLKAHYAPRTPLVLCSRQQLEAVALGQDLAAIERVAVIAHTRRPPHCHPALVWRTIAAEPAGYAHILYALLRELDHQNYRQILIEAPPRSAEWDAINDRLRRAAAAFNREAVLASLAPRVSG